MKKTLLFFITHKRGTINAINAARWNKEAISTTIEYFQYFFSNKNGIENKYTAIANDCLNISQLY